MSKSNRSFDRVIIPAPCDADWDSMADNDRVRAKACVPAGPSGFRHVSLELERFGFTN